MQLTHYIQLYFSKNFCQYDFRWNNLDFYNTTTPTEYDVGRIVAPVHLYAASEDLLVSKLVRIFKSFSKH